MLGYAYKLKNKNKRKAEQTAQTETRRFSRRVLTPCSARSNSQRA